MKALPIRVALVLGALTLVACEDDGGTQPGTLRFGQLGEASVVVETPVEFAGGSGALSQAVSWSSSGQWQLTETISYRGLEGDRTVVRSVGDASTSAGLYASWIAQVNETPALSLFIDGLDPDLDPRCGPFRSRVRVTIRDDPRGETVDWVRCADGPLGDLETFGAGTDPFAGRVVQAAILLRDATVGRDFRSEYRGSVPYATLLRGDDLEDDPGRSFTITDGSEWRRFWSRVSSGAPPDVDFAEELVLVAAVGPRMEAGDSVEIRRVLPVGDGTVVEVVERTPGDFCSPAELPHVPFHVVVSPVVPAPVAFNRTEIERVPCG